MSRAPVRFTRAELARAIRAALQAGMSIGRIEIDRDGKIVVVAGHPEPIAPPSEANEWDAV